MKSARESLDDTLREHNRKMADPSQSGYHRRVMEFNEMHRQMNEGRAEHRRYDRDGYCDNPGRGY